MKKYIVTLECNTLHDEEVEAESKEEAEEIALNQGRGQCFGDSMTVYEVQLIKKDS
jgi:hypothetical protein